MKDFMINVTDVILHIPQSHVLREKDKLAEKDFDFVKEIIADRIQKAQNSDEILACAYDMVKNEQRRVSNFDRNFHIDRNEKLIGRMKEFLMQNLRFDTIITRKSLREAFCIEDEYEICENDDYKEVMYFIGYYSGDIKATTVIDEALADLEKEGKIEKVKFLDPMNPKKTKTGYMLTGDDF